MKTTTRQMRCNRTGTTSFYARITANPTQIGVSYGGLFGVGLLEYENNKWVAANEIPSGNYPEPITVNIRGYINSFNPAWMEFELLAPCTIPEIKYLGINEYSTSASNEMANGNFPALERFFCSYNGDTYFPVFNFSKCPMLSYVDIHTMKLSTANLLQSVSSLPEAGDVERTIVLSTSQAASAGSNAQAKGWTVVINDNR